MSKLLPLRGAIQHYAWGSHTMLPDFLGIAAPDPKPWAELWLGTHPLGPAEVFLGGDWTPLSTAIEADPIDLLGGPPGRGSDAPTLPFLMKVLAVDQPLSLQVHPSTAQATAGLEREAPLAATQRHYKDASGKPEILCAVTPFSSLCGWRGPAAVAADLRAIGAERFGVRELAAGAFPAAVAQWLGERACEARAGLAGVVAAAADRCREHSGNRFDWVIRLAQRHPGDPGVLAPLWLHLVELAPKEALYLAAGEPHAHLAGMAVELTPSSDNVIRGGLTQKRIDVEEFLAIASHTAGSPVRPGLREDGLGWRVYDAAVGGFSLAYCEARNDRRAEGAAPAILLCGAGRVRVETAGGEHLELERGQSCFVPAAANPYGVTGSGELFRAAAARPSPGATVP